MYHYPNKQLGRDKMKKLKNISYYIIPLLVAFFNVLIVIVPDLVITSAQNGLMLWFNKVLPAILPFLIGTNLLIQLGFIDFLGTLLEPIMKKIFNVSGYGAFALILGMFSGYPIGAKITATLREEKKISKVEAQRLISFTNNSGPLFIIGTVGIGMFGSIELGYFILAIHYISAFTVGYIFRFYKISKDNDKNPQKTSIKLAFRNLQMSRMKNKKTFGEILSDSVRSSLETICMIGGFIILFSVIAEIFKASNILGKFSNSDIANGTLIGIIEITNGINILSKNLSVISVMLTSMIISFSGLSITAQTVSMISKSDIDLKIYILSKILHSVISLIYCLPFIKIIEKMLNNSTTSTFNSSLNSLNLLNANMLDVVKVSILSFMIGIFSLVLICLILLTKKDKRK